MNNNKSGYIGTYSCDAGSIKIVTDGLTLRLPNGVGDGDFSVFVLVNLESVIDLVVPDEPIKYVCEISAKSILIHDYDCTDSKVLVELSGTYHAYLQAGDFIFIKGGGHQ